MDKLQYLLIKLSEECDELGQRASKALIFGLDEVQAEQKFTNAQRIVYEYNDILAVMEMLLEEKGIDKIIDREAIEKKKNKIKKWMLYSRERGILTE